MVRIFLIVVAFFCFIATGVSQNENTQSKVKNKPDIVLYSNTGLSFLNYKNLQSQFTENGIDYPTTAMNLGAGYYSTFGRIRFGMDFGSTKGSVDNSQYVVKHNGSFFSINLGYHILQKSGFVIAPVIGYSSTRNNVIIENKQAPNTVPYLTSLNSTSIENNVNAIKLQLSVEKVLKSGLYAGLSFGYDYSFGNHKWIATGNINDGLPSDNMNNIYINLNIGTHLNFKNK